MAIAGYVAPNPSKNVLIPHGVKLLFKRTGTTSFINLGDLSDVSVTPAAEYFEYNTNHTGQSTLGKKLLTNRALTIDATLNEVTNENLRLAFLGDDPIGDDTFEPAAVETITIPAGTSASTVSAVFAELNTGVTAVTGTDGTVYDDWTAVGTTSTPADDLVIAADIVAAAAAADLELVCTVTIPFNPTTGPYAAGTVQKTEILSKSTATGEAQFQIRNNEGGFAQIYVIDDVTLAPNGAMATPADGVQTLPIQLTAQIKDGKFGRIYTANV